MSTPISIELSKQIEREAKPAAQSRYRFPLIEYGEGGMHGYEKGYIAGATAYAHYKERWEQAMKALEEQVADLRKKIKAFTDLLPQVEQRMLTAKKQEDWYEEKECKVLITVWGTNVKQWTETLTGIEALLASWKEEGKEGGV